MNQSPTAISLFSSGGIGDLALNAAGAKVLVANEIVPERVSLFRRNFPETRMIEGDIWSRKDEIIRSTRAALGDRTLDIMLASPPCQGMSKNGRGKLLWEIRNNGRAPMDPRNQLIIPALQIAQALQPRLVVFENVPEMERTAIMDPESGELIGILDYAKRALGPSYAGSWRTLEFADYGVPQNRQRLITIFTRETSILQALREGRATLHPDPTHSSTGSNGLPRWRSVRDTIGGLEPLDARSADSARSKTNPLHFVPLLDQDKYFWVSNTPEGSSAFDNQCVNPSCGFDANQTHRASRTKEGINRASCETPIRCERCNSVLPRPWVRVDGDFRLMKGFTSAYRRMDWDKPATTLTRNFPYACSDKKIHPSQNRTLSIYEAMLLNTISDHDYTWELADRKPAPKKVIYDVIGESIPPRPLQIVFEHLIQLLQGKEQKVGSTPLQCKLTLSEN